ncbi:MAG: sugar transferase [Gemmataceae bacterium]|nr:sugar transferase [Gemmataceae bacterium]
MAASTPRRWYLPCKSALDVAVAVLLLVPALPVILIAVALVKLTSRGPGFYTQLRVGKHGRVFSIYKIRTMQDQCESLTGPRWALPKDPRVTLVGRFLRLSHLDELPQLLNILRGDMSLIGPRPERPEFLPRLERALPAYRDRLLVRPGVTGLAQVQLPADTNLASVHRKLAHDLHYVRSMGPVLDLCILLATMLYVLRLPSWLIARLTALPSPEKTIRHEPAPGGETNVPGSLSAAPLYQWSD